MSEGAGAESGSRGESRWTDDAIVNRVHCNYDYVGTYFVGRHVVG